MNQVLRKFGFKWCFRLVTMSFFGVGCGSSPQSDFVTVTMGPSLPAADLSFFKKAELCPVPVGNVKAFVHYSDTNQTEFFPVDGVQFNTLDMAWEDSNPNLSTSFAAFPSISLRVKKGARRYVGLMGAVVKQTVAGCTTTASDTWAIYGESASIDVNSDLTVPVGVSIATGGFYGVMMVSGNWPGTTEATYEQKLTDPSSATYQSRFVRLEVRVEGLPDAGAYNYDLGMTINPVDPPEASVPFPSPTNMPTMIGSSSHSTAFPSTTRTQYLIPHRRYRLDFFGKEFNGSTLFPLGSYDLNQTDCRLIRLTCLFTDNAGTIGSSCIARANAAPPIIPACKLSHCYQGPGPNVGC